MDKPKTIFLTGGRGTAPIPYKLLAFDRALRMAGIADYNHIKVSSIFPPGARVSLALPLISVGTLVPTVYSYCYGDAGQIISACIAIAIPEDDTDVGVLFETSGNMMDTEITDRAVTMATMAMADRHIKVREIIHKTEVLVVQDDTVGCVVIAAVMD